MANGIWFPSNKICVWLVIGSIKEIPSLRKFLLFSSIAIDWVVLYSENDQTERCCCFVILGPRFRKNLCNYSKIIWRNCSTARTWNIFCELLYTLHELFKDPATIYFSSRYDCLQIDSMHCISERAWLPISMNRRLSVSYLNTIAQFAETNKKNYQ